MKASDVVKILDGLAPRVLAYANEELGFVVGSEKKEVVVVGITERPTVKVLQEAVAKKVDMMIIHEPLYHVEKSMLIDKTQLTFPPNQKRKELVETGKFAIFRYHSQWDAAEGGNNDVLAEILGVKVTEKIPFGRMGNIEAIKLKAFAEQVKEKLESDGISVIGDLEQEVGKVAIIAGSGNSLTEMMEYAKNKGADVMVSGDITDGRARFAEEIDLAIIDAGDYLTENPGAKSLAELLQEKFSNLKILHLDPGKPWATI